MSVLQIKGTKSYGKLTQNAGTVITRLIEPRQGLFTHLTSVVYTAAATAHTLTVMRPLNRVTLTASAAASQAVINISADPGDYTGIRTTDNGIAGSDFVVLQLSDGTFQLNTVSSVSTLAITLTDNVAFAMSSGAYVWWFGVIGDTNPNDAQTHPQFNLFANSTTVLGGLPGDQAVGFCGTFPGILSNMTGKFEPMILHSGNATNAGTLERCTAVYATKG